MRLSITKSLILALLSLILTISALPLDTQNNDATTCPALNHPCWSGGLHDGDVYCYETSLECMYGEAGMVVGTCALCNGVWVPASSVPQDQWNKQHSGYL